MASKNIQSRPKDKGVNEQHSEAADIDLPNLDAAPEAGNTDDRNETQTGTNGMKEMSVGNPETADQDTYRNAPRADAGGNDERSDGEAGGDISVTEREGIKESVRRDVEKDTGRPTGAIHGHQGDTVVVPNEFNEEENR